MRIKLFLAFAALILLMGVGTTYQLYQLKQQQAVYVKNDLSAISQRLANEVTFWSDQQIRRITFLAGFDAIKNMLPEQQQPMLQNAVDPDDWSSLLFITDKDGHAIVRSDDQPLRSYSDRTYVSNILAGDTSAQQLLISQNKPIPLQCFSVPIYPPEFTLTYDVTPINIDDHILQGVLVQCAALEHIGKKFITSPNGLVKTTAWLIDENNRLIAHSDIKNHTPKLQPLKNHPALKSDEDMLLKEIDIDGEKLVVLVSTINFGWRLIVQQPYAQAFGQYEKSQKLLLWLTGIMLLVALSLAVLLSHYLFSPLKELTAVVKKISKGRFSEKIPYTNQQSDIGDLAKAIDKMGLNLRLALKRIRSGLSEKPTVKK